MKKLVSLMLVLALALTVACAASAEEKPFAGQTLTVSTFSFNAELLEKNIYKPFEELTGAHIEPVGKANAQRVTDLSMAAPGDYDVVVIGDLFVMQLIEAGKIDTIDAAALTNLPDIYENARAPLGAEYGPAYTFNRLGIVVNPDECPVEITSYADLWNPALADSIVIPEITNTSGPLFYYGVAAAFGLTPGTDDEAIFAKLAELKPNVLNTYTSASAAINALNTGEASVAILLDYSYTSAKAANPAYQWVNPAEGMYAGYNMLNIVAGTEKKELAEAFINFYLSYDVQNAEAVDGVDSPVRGDVELSEEQAGNFTYGEMINDLVFVDWDLVMANREAWIASWNTTFGVQ
jgi:putative spermidine/putrescine transport system substrate-binding protein